MSKLYDVLEQIIEKVNKSVKFEEGQILTDAEKQIVLTNLGLTNITPGTPAPSPEETVTTDVSENVENENLVEDITEKTQEEANTEEVQAEAKVEEEALPEDNADTEVAVDSSLEEIKLEKTEEIKAGEKIAFVGPSGSGKTTLVKLLLKFFSIFSYKLPPLLCNLI